MDNLKDFLHLWADRVMIKQIDIKEIEICDRV